jgi:hypothetical protein
MVGLQKEYQNTLPVNEVVTKVTYNKKFYDV